MVVDPTLLETAHRLKRSTTNRDVLALCEAIIGWAGRSRTEVQVQHKSAGGAGAACPECERRRSRRTAAQARWRKGKRNGTGQG